MSQTLSDYDRFEIWWNKTGKDKALREIDWHYPPSQVEWYAWYVWQAAIESINEATEPNRPD